MHKANALLLPPHQTVTPSSHFPSSLRGMSCAKCFVLIFFCGAHPSSLSLLEPSLLCLSLTTFSPLLRELLSLYFLLKLLHL